MSNAPERPQIGTIDWASKPKRTQEYYEEIKQKFAEERDLRLKYRPEGTQAVHLRSRRSRWRATKSIRTARR